MIVFYCVMLRLVKERISRSCYLWKCWPVVSTDRITNLEQTELEDTLREVRFVNSAPHYVVPLPASFRISVFPCK